MTFSTLRSTFVVLAAVLMFLLAFAISQNVLAETVIQYDPITITNEAQLKGAGIVPAQAEHMSDELVAELKAAPFGIINEALLKGEGIYSEQHVMEEALIEDLKAAPFSIINEALFKGEGIYTER